MAKRSKGLAPASRPPGRLSSATSSPGSTIAHGARQETHGEVQGWIASVQQEILTATYWFVAREEGEPYTATILFFGRRVRSARKPHPRDTFSQEETIEGIVPGRGPVSVTTRVHGINPGEWTVVAQLAGGRNGPSSRAEARRPSHGADAVVVEHAVWPGRTPAVPEGLPGLINTALAPFARMPGVVRFAWPVVVGLGIVIGLVLQAILLARVHAQVGAGLLVSLSAVLAGSVAAKVWYIAVHRGRRYDGWCIQGFLLGMALVAGTVPIAILNMSVGAFLDTAAAALLIGMVAGRPACFLAGCCAGRPTASRWGLWSSDQRVGMHRVPTQLMEALLCLPVGVAALILILGSRPERPGAVFVGAVAAYTLGRQFLLPLRAEPRKTSIGRLLTTGVAALALVADVVISAAA